MPAPEGVRRGKKVGFVDGVRGLGALVVVFHHFSWAFLPAMVGGDFALMHVHAEKYVYFSPLFLLIAGQFAVCTFFVLSGFALSHKFFQTQRTEEATSGAVRRYFRLAPVVLVAVLLSCGLLMAGLYFNNQAVPVTASPWLARSWQGAASFVDAFKLGTYGAFFGASSSVPLGRYDNVLWTMQIEFFGSFMVFAFLALFGKQRWRWLPYAIALGLLRNTYYLGFVFGVMLCDWYVLMQKRERPTGSPVLGYPLLVAGLAGGSLSLAQAQPQLLLVAAAATLGGVIMVPAVQRLLERRPVRYLGRVSFSMYVVHLLIIASLGCWLFVHLVHHLSYGRSVVVDWLVCMPLVFVAAEALTRLVDQPAVKYSGVLYRRWFAGQKPPAEATEPVGVPGPSLEPAAVPVLMDGAGPGASDMMVPDE